MIAWLIFTTIVGACVGSFLNVVVYRLPRGLSVVNPPSSCPKCDHKLAAWDNVPVLGWLWLRGKCRYCKNPISIQYPIVEAVTGLLFGGWFAVCYLTQMQPGYSGPGINTTALIFIVTCILLSALIVGTIIDARMFIIPLSICWVITVCALVMLPLSTALFPKSVQHIMLPNDSAAAPGLSLIGSGRLQLKEVREPYRYHHKVELAIQQYPPLKQVEISAAPLVSAKTTACGIGGIIGLLISIVLMKLKLLPRSFDIPLTEEEIANWPDNEEAVLQLPIIIAPLIGAGLALIGAGGMWSSGWGGTDVLLRAVIGMIAGYVVVLGIMLAGRKWVLKTRDDVPETEADDDQAQLAAPIGNVRIEMLKECAFIAIPITVGLLTMKLIGEMSSLEGDVIRTLGGVLFGYLIGAATVWATRIGGSLLFGKEAMGLGDVHLMGAVGAVCGWKVAVVAFFMAPFFGLTFAVVSLGLGKVLRLKGVQIPYGPHLAVATGVVMLWEQPLMVMLGGVFGV